jgi:hypothetical protein
MIIGERSSDAEVCEFHFRGGDVELVERFAKALSHIVGPLVIYAHSGSYTKLVQPDLPA